MTISELDRNTTFLGTHLRLCGVAIFTVYGVSVPDGCEFYWAVDIGPMKGEGKEHGPFPTAEGAFLDAIGD